MIRSTINILLKTSDLSGWQQKKKNFFIDNKKYYKLTFTDTLKISCETLLFLACWEPKAGESECIKGNFMKLQYYI